MYARFFTKALADLGLPRASRSRSPALFTQGMITRDGAKMSKSRGQRHLARRPTSSATGPTPRAPTSSSSARPTRTPTGPTRASRACTASSARLWRLSAETADQTPDHPMPDELSEADAGARCARRTGRSRRSPTTWPAASPSTRRSRPIMELINDGLHAARGGRPVARRAALRAGHRRLAAVPVRAAHRRRRLRAADRRARVGGAVAGAPTSAARARHLRARLPGQRQGPRPRAGADAAPRARSSRRCAWRRPRSRPTSTARRSSRSSSCPSKLVNVVVR